jgi:hypothetical protein
LKFFLYEMFGDPPTPGGGILLGHDGQSADKLIQQLLALYGDQLASVEVLT